MDVFFANQGILLPILWVGISLVAALILYWTSKAFLTATELFGIPVKQVRLGGSVVIFGLVFVILQQATRANTVAVPKEHLERLAEAVSETDTFRVEVAECIATNALDRDDCRDSVDALRRHWLEVKRRADAVTAAVQLSPEEAGKTGG